MGLADEVRRRKSEKQQARTHQSKEHEHQAEQLFSLLDELGPEVIDTCVQEHVAKQKIAVPGQLGKSLSKEGWVIALAPAASDSASSFTAIAFYPDGTWDFVKEAVQLGHAAYQAELRWLAIEGASAFLVGQSKDSLTAAIADYLSGA